MQEINNVPTWVNHAWLGLGDISNIPVNNPLINRSQEDIENIDLCVARLMRNPEYLAFAAKTLLDIDLLPIQTAILYELWTKPFPMFVATRGFGKCIRDSYIIKDDGFYLINNLFKDSDNYNIKLPIQASILGNNNYHSPAYKWKTKKESIKLTTRCGFNLIGSTAHPVQVVNNNEIVWKKISELKLGDYIVIDRNKDKIWYTKTNNITIDEAYLFGCLIGDGGYTKKGNITLTSNDIELIDKCNRISKKLWNKEFKPQKSKYSYLLCGIDIWNNLFTKYGFNSFVCAEKDFPSSILSAPKESVASFIRGLMDTDGCIRKTTKLWIEYASKSKNLINTLQFVLSRFGIISQIKKRLNKKYNKYYYYLYIFGANCKLFYNEIGFGLSRKQIILKSMLDTKTNTNIDIIPKELILDKLLILRDIFCQKQISNNDCKLISKYRLKKYKMSYDTLFKIINIFSTDINCVNTKEFKEIQIIFDKHYFYDSLLELENMGEQDLYDIYFDEDDHSYISSGFISHNSWLLAVYALLKCALYPGTKIVIVGAGFRQAKVIFEYMETLWRDANILKSICDENSGPRRDVDRCTMKINTSWAIAVPLGDGSKIRGLRANIIISDEFACLSHNSLVETDCGLIRIGDDNCNNKKLFTGDNNQLWEKPNRYIKTPLTDVYEIKLENGYVIRCSKNHKVMTKDGWKKPLELTNKDYIESHNQYTFPIKQISGLDERMAWLMGILISEGAVVNKSLISITTTNINLANFISKEFGFTISVRKEHTDKRGWHCKECYQVYQSNKVLRDKLAFLGLEYNYAIDKKVPWSILQSPKNIILAFLEGAFEGDGSCFTFSDKTCNNRLGVAYYSVSETLCRDIHILLDKLGYDGYINNRISDISDNLQWFVRLNGNDAYNFASLMNIDRFKQPLLNCYNPKEPLNITWDKNRNKWKTHFVYCGKKIQKRYKTKDEAIIAINKLKNLPRFRLVKSITKLDKQEHLYDYYLPNTHSFYACGSRQHNSIPPDIYETVVAGFAAVSSNPITNVKEAARRKELSKLGIWTADAEYKYNKRQRNQAIISGTADYAFKSFASYWKRYCNIIKSNNDPKILKEILNLDEVPDGFNAEDYSVIRVPYELVPEGFMDEKQIIRAKATMNSGIYALEYGAVFVSDSEGFFKRSLIEKCVGTVNNPIIVPSGPVWFDTILHGSKNYEYILGIDPASETDNFSMIVMELHSDHSRIVYGWSTNRQDFKRRLQKGLTNKDDFYGFCARKIRDLMKAFNIIAIGIDGQGGGVAIEEALHDTDKMEPGELPIWPIIEDKEKDTDDKPGLHILHICQFANFDWTSRANHGMRKDFEDKILLFPRFDPIILGLAVEEDGMRQKAFEKQFPEKTYNLYDTLEDSVMELEELKNELSTIVMTQTGTGVGARDRWDTPEIKLPNGKKGKLRKDRYSALVIANMISRQYKRADIPPEYNMIGDFAQNIIIDINDKSSSYIGPEWFTKGMDEVLSIMHTY